MIGFATKIGMIDQSSLVDLGPPPPPPPVSLNLSQTDNTVEITAQLTGDLTIIITNSIGFNGTYIIDPMDLLSGPVNLVAPTINGTAQLGETLVVRPGLWIYFESTIPPVITYQWQRDGSAINGETNLSHVVTTTDEGSSLTLSEQVTDTAGTRSAQSTAVIIAQNAPPLSLTRIGDFQGLGNNTPTPEFTVDLTGCNAGDTIIFFYGTQRYSAAASVNGAAAIKISTDAGNNGAGRMSGFSYTLPSDGGPGTIIAVSLPSSNNQHVLSLHCAKNAVVQHVDQTHSSNGGTLSTSLTVASTTNAVLACAMGVSFGDGVFDWIGAIPEDTATVSTASSRNISVATQTNVGVGLHDVTGTPSGTSHTGLISVLIEGI